MPVTSFIQAFRAGCELANAATWKNAQLLGSKLAILLGALLAIANAFGYFPQVTTQDALTVAGGIAVLVGMLNGTATVVSSPKIGLRGLPASGTDTGGGEPVTEPTPARVQIPVEPQPVDPQPEQPDIFHNRSLG